MAERPLYTLYKNLKAQNYDVPDDYNKFESALTRDGKGGADNRHAIYENLKAQNFDVPSTYERFYSALFEPRSKTSSRAKGGSVPMSAADRARFSAGAAAISASAQQTMNNAGRYNRLKQRKHKQQKDFGRVNLGTHQTPYGGDANNVVKDDFAYNPETGKTGAYVTSDNENVYSLPEAEQMQAILDKQNDAYQVAVDTGEIPSAFDVRDKNGNYDLQENIGKNGTYLTEEGAQKQFDKKLADAYARKKEIEALIAEDNRQHGNPLLSYGASIGAGNGRTAEQSDYRNKLATSLSLVTEQIGALEAVKQYPTSSWGEDALKALDNTAFTAKTWDFGLTDFATMGQMERIKTKMDNKIPLSGSDKMLLKSKLGADAAAALEDEKMGNIYRWTKIAGQSLPFMADFFLTGGYGGITKGISRGALKFAAKRGMGKVSAAILKNTGIMAGDVIGSYAMAGTEQALKTGADIMQRHLGNLYQDEKGDYKFGTFDENGNLLHEGGESMGTALYKGLTSAMVENYTEKLFGHNYGIKKGAVNFMEKHGMNASAEFFKNIGKSGWYTNSKKWMGKFGINGFAEEVMEEEIGIPLHALLDGEGKVSDLLDAKQQLDIIGGMAISVGSMYAMGAGSRPVKGIYNRAQYYRFRNKVNVADSDAQNLMGDNWADIKDKIDNATNEQMGSVLADILRKRDTMTKEQINAAVNYGANLMKMRGYNIAKTAEMNAKEITNEPTTPEEQHQADIDNAYSEGHDADDADKHDIQIQQEDQMKTLAAALGISEQQLSAMSDEELESLTGQDDKLDQAIYDYQLSSARYQGVVDDAQDKVDLAAHQAEQRVDMYTDQSRGSVRNATIKASGGLEDYGVYIISGNIATHDDGSIDVSNSDDMILYYDPTTNSVEHADALMFAELGEELPADEVKAQAVADAKENAIKEVAGIIDGTIEVGSQFKVTGADGMEHTYEVLADYGDGTAAISIDGNVVENPYSLADLQQMKDLEDQKRLEAAKAEREQMEKERAAQQTQETEETQPSFDFNQILNDNGNVVLVDVLDKDGNTKYPDSRLFLIRDAGAKAKVVELKSDGTIVPHAVNKEDVATISSMSLDEYKQAMPESSMIEDNSGENIGEDSQLANLGLSKGSEIWMSGDGLGRPKENTLSRVVGIDEQGSIILEDKDGKKWSASFDYINNHRELPPLDENTNIVNEENNQSESNADENTPAPEQTPAMTLEDGTIVPMLEDGNPDFSKLTAEQTAELYDTQFGEDADSIVSGYVSDAKKALDKASNMTVKGKTFVEQKAAKDAKEKAIADAQAAYDSAIAIRDAYNERQLAKVEDTAEGRRELIEKARRKFARLKSAVKDDAEAVAQIYKETVGTLLHRLYDGTGIDVTDTIPLTAEEYVVSNLGAHSLNYEGTETSKGVKQETGLSREDFAKTQLLAAYGKGTTIDALVHSLWENRPSNLESLDTQDIRAALLDIINSGFKASEARNFVENIRIAQAENILEEQKRAQENAAYAEQHKAEPEAELKAKSDEKAELKAKSEAKLDNESDNKSNDLSNETDNEKTNDNINDNINTLTPEQQKAMEKGEKLGFPAFDKEGEPINQYVIELANWAKEQGLEIDPTSKSNSYADLFLMCKDGFGVSTLVPDEGENINQVVYFPDNVQDFDQLWKLQEEFNAGRDLKHSSNIDSEITEGATFYDADTAREFKEFVDKKVEKQNKVFGEQRPEEDLPFSAKENGKQQTNAERSADVEKNKVDDMKVVDSIVGQKTRKAFDRLAKMMGANIQWQYSDKLGNGWIQETTDADGNVHRTIFITLDSSITEGAQFIFGHEMTHQIKNLNPAAYNELTQLVLDTYGSDAFDKAVDETMQRYSDAGFSGRARDYYAEEVVADAVGEMIRDLNLAHTLAMKMSHPLLAAIHEILQKIKLAFFGTEYSDVTKNIIRSIEQAYVKTANGQVTNSETGEDVSFSLRQKPEPKKKGVGYKVFVLKDGKLYPPMVANPDGAATTVGVWLDADAAPIAGESKTGIPQVKQGGKGTQGGSGKLAYRPGWHLGVVPYAIQFNRKDAEGNKTLFPKNFVFAEVEYAADVDYQEEARQEGINPSGKYQHSLAGLKHLPTDGYYMYRTNPNPETDPWVITGAMKVNRILTRVEQADLVSKSGREPQQIQEGDIVTDDVVNSINQEIADAPKFSLKVYHGSGADFTEFDFDHMGEGAGSQAFGWGGYVTSSEEIGKSYVELTRKKPTYVYNGKEMSEDDLRSVLLDKVGIDNANILDDFLYNLEKYGVSEAKSILRKGDYAYFKDLLKGTRGSIRSGYQNKVDAAELILAPRNIRVKKYNGNLYEVDIPDDNGSNYLDWDAPITDELIDKVAKVLPSLRSYDIKDLKKDRTFDNFYKTISMRSVKDDASFNDDKAASKLLASLGYTGIKYKAGRNFGGAEEGDTNYVIFKPEDMKITEHTKFSLKTYHGTGANFDRFDTSHAYEGAGSETFGHGIYVTKSAKIGASYALKAKVKKIKTPKAFKAIKNGDNWFGRFIDNAVRSSFAKSKKETFNRMDELIKEDENIVNDETKPEWKKNAAQKELADFDKLKSLFEGLTEEDIPSLKRAKANRYEVEIPDDTGNNYLDWNKPMNKEQKKIVREGLEKLGVDVDRLVRNGYSLDKNFGDVYNGLLYYALNGTKFEERDSFVASSNFLSSLGFTGIKYYAGTIWGGAKKGDLNYVIFNEDDAKIVGNTKFSLKKVNDAFNQRLDELVKNPNQKDKILHLGRSSSFLKAGGITDAEIELDFDKFIRKSGDKYKNNHPFAASDLINLPMALAEPIAVFNSTTANDHVVLTELQKDGKKFIVAVRAVEQHRKGGVVLEVNQITSLYPKEEKGIINWVNTGRISNVDKEKALHFIEALQPHAGTSITDEELKSAANIINSFETTKENGEKVDSDGTKFSLKDEEYLKAVEDGNMEKAQKMVNEAADAAGYSTDSSYQGTSAFNGAAPWGNGYFLTKDERKEAWDNGEFEGESTLGDYINDDIDGGNLEELTNAASYRAADPMRKDAIDNVRNAIQKKANTITMYRSVPSDVKEGSFRNGDWVTPSRAYAVDNAKLHGWGDDYNIIEQKVPVDDVWFDGNDIAEWGYGREEDYINDTDFAYKNSKNNKKLLDAVTYDDNGNVIPLSQRFNEKNNDVRFSLKDEKTMFGMHNISVDKLRKAIKQGGFAAPSMGVVDSKNGIYSDYGEITLIPKAEKLAKRTGKNAGTFTADAWTPTYPQVERIMNKQGEKAFNTDMNVKLGDVDNGIYSNVRESWKGYLSSGDVRVGLYWHYLFDKGMNPETIYQTGKYDNDITNEVMRISDNGNKTDYTDKEVAELIQLMNKATGKDNDVDAQREKLKARIASAEKQGKHLLVALKKKRLEELEGVENFYIAADFVNDVVRNNRKNGKVDVHDTMGAAKKKVEDNKKLSDDFPSWLDKKTEEYGVEEMLYNGTTPSGKPKYIPNTIDNAVKLMKKQGVAGGYTAFGSELGVFIAKNSPEVNTLAAMKNAKDKLIPFGDERHNQIKDKITKEFLELSDEIRVGSNNRYAFDDSGVSRMVELTDNKGNEKEYLKKAYNVEVSDEWMDRYNKLLDTIKKDYKVFYFETKFMRPYGLDEFEKAIVPNDTPSDVVDALKNAGIDVSSYERGNAEDRQKVTMDAINSSDNIRFSLKSMMEKPEGWKQANKKAIHIAEAIERDPKFSLKSLDGTLIKAGTYFSGGGLVEEGLKGIIDPVVAVEYDEKISGVYRNNFGQHIVTADVRDVDPKELVKQIDGEVEYFHASPVCKNYSQAKSNHAEVELDKETAASTAEFINAVKPKVVTIENVKGYKDSEAMKIITDALDANGYTWDADVYNAADYGGYTNRERLIVRAVRDGKLPEKPKKMARKSGWYEAVADIIPTLTEKKNGVAPWMDIRLKADGIDWKNIDKPLYVMGSAYADGKVPHAFADELLPTLRTKSGDVIVMPDGKVYRAMGRVLARVSGVSDDYKMPFSENLSHTIIGNGIPTQLTEHVIAPLLTGSDPKFSLKKTKNVKDSRIIPTDVDKSVSSQIEKKYDSAIKEVMNKVAERDKRLVSNYIEQDLSDFSKMRREDINQELKSNENWRRKNLREENREGSTYGITDARHRITEATAERELEYRDARAKYLSETYGLQGGRQTSLDMVDRAFEDTLGNETNRGELRELYGRARKILVQVGAEFGGVDNAKQEGDLGFAGTDRDISLFIDTMTRTSTPPSELSHTILHEMIHQATIGSINLVKKGMADGMLTPKQIEAVNTIINTYDAYKADRRLVWEEDNYRDYGGKDEYEFAAEMADVKQRRILSIPYGERILNAANELKRVGDISLWQAIKNALRRLFEVSDKSKMDKALSDIMDDFNKNIDDISMNNIEQTDFGLNGNTRFSLRYDKFEHDLNQWKKDNNLPKDAQRPTIPQRNAGESAVDFLRRVDEYRKQMALWKTAPTYEQHLLSDDTALGEFNRELQRGSVLKRIAFQDSMLAIRKAQEAIMKEVGVDRLNMAEDAYTAENRSHGKGKNEFEEYNNEFLQPLRKAYHQMKKVLGDSYDNVRIYMMAKHGLERDAQMAFKKSLDADFEDVAQRSAAYKAYKGDMNRIINDSDLEFGRVDFNTWRQRDNALRTKYSPSYMDFRYDENGAVNDYSGLSKLFGGSDFEESAYKLVKDIEDKYVTETHNLWDATNAATKKILRDGYKAGMMSKDTYQYVRDMYSHYIPLRGWDGTTADQVWDYVGGGKGAFNQTLKTAHGRTSIADDPIAYIENMAESGILLNNKNWVKQHLMLLAQNHPTSLLTLSKAWYVKSTDANGNEEWIPATPQITSQMDSNQVKAAIDAFEKKMEQMAQTGDATQKRDGLNIAYPQTHSEEREHEVRVMKDGEEYVIYVNGDPQLAQAMNNTRAHRVREIQSGKLDRAAAWLGRKMAAAYTSLSPLFIPSNYFRDLTMTLASTAIREDAKYNYLLRKNLATSWNLGFMLKDYQNGKLREKVSNGNATKKEQMFYDFMMNGGETGFVSSLDVEDLKKKFKNDLKDLDRWKANPVKVGHTIMDSIEFLNRMIEDSNRFAVYMTSIQYGRSIDEAVNDAKNVTLNFNRKGTGEYGWQMIRNLYLFINPAVQSLQTLGALAKHHPFKFTAVTASWLASGVLVPVVNAALMSLFGGDDDKDKYWQFSKWDRRNNLIMWIPYTHEYVKIPLAQEFRAFYGVGDMIASKMMGGELAEESWEEYAEDLMGQVVDMLPLDPTGYDGNIAVSLMPNAIRPVFELAFNVDFTGKPLFKDTEYNKYDPNFTKAYVGTPDWLVRASKMVNSIGNDYPDVQQNGIDAFGDPRYNLNNPAVTDHVLSSYLGGAYIVGSQVLGLLTKSLNDPKEIKVADIPLFSKFVSNPDDRPVTKKQGDEFWNMKENHDRAANTLSKLKKQAKVNGDYSMLERFYGSEEYKQYKQDDAKVKKYEEDKKKERAEESGEEYRPHKLNAEDIYKAHATPKDDFEDLKLKQLYTKLNGFKSAYDLLVDTAPSQSDGYYNTNKAAIDAIDEISLDKQEISELKKGFLDDGKDAYNAEDMKQIRELRKKILAVLEKANKVVVANQKAKAEK